MYPYRVDPTNIPKHLNNPMLEYFTLFGIAVAGKSAVETEKKLWQFMERNSYYSAHPIEPFDTVRNLVMRGELDEELHRFKFGQYARISRAFRAVYVLDVADFNLNVLEGIPGIGPKTARMIMLYSDPSFNGVPLDTHVLKYLDAMGVRGVPHSTPPKGLLYARLEAAFCDFARNKGKTVRELDTEVWKAYNSGQQHKLVGG